MNRNKHRNVPGSVLPWVTPRKLLLLFVLINLIVGVFIVGDYGNITDEDFEIGREVYALRMYSIPSIDEIPKFSQAKNEMVLRYGTAISMLFQMAENLFRPLLGTHPRVIAHYTYFIVFQLGVVAFYLIARRFTKDWVALASTVLFATQPLFFGHAFINPKDTPLMAIFLVTVAAGLTMVDKFSPTPRDFPAAAQEESAHPIRQQLSLLNKPYMMVISLLMAVCIIFPEPVVSVMRSFIRVLYDAPVSSLPGKVFALFAAEKSSVGLETYFDKLDFLVLHFVIPLFVVVLLGLLTITLVYLIRAYYKNNKAGSNEQGSGQGPTISTRDLLRKSWPSVILAGFLWGICMATRFIGFSAGGLVLLYFVLRAGKRSLLPTAVYTAVAVITMYLFWPYLWQVDIGELVNITQLLSDFPHPTSVLFNGAYYSSYQLPAGYLPRLFLLQFSEPALFLSGLGVFSSIYLLFTRRIDWKLLVTVLCWFFVPFFFVILNNTPLYNNFRHLLFITPPLFILAGIALQQIAGLTSRKWLTALLVVVCLLPNLLTIVQLHPYQYIYYNGYAGGVEGAYRKYELDYWMTSLKESAEYINQVAEPGARVCIFYVGKGLSENYLRPGIQVIGTETLLGQENPDVDIVVLPPRLDADLRYFTDYPTAHQVMVDGVNLAAIKIIR